MGALMADVAASGSPTIDSWSSFDVDHAID
jgi:hypothetical protein